MLEAAGVEFDVEAPGIDEAALKAGPWSSLTDDLAEGLASAKALNVSLGRAGDWVIGSDSVVNAGGRMFGKPQSRSQAADHLRAFSGQDMQLTSAVALARDGRVDWSHCETATLRVRELSDDFIAGYLDREWPAVSHCVGVFRLEGPGVQLFDSIDGDHFTILGMPLLPLLGALRERRLLSS
jgi:septum formation protein